jgi:hypothetical protein
MSNATNALPLRHILEERLTDQLARIERLASLFTVTNLALDCGHSRGPHGERYSVRRYYAVRNGQPVRRCRLRLWKTRSDAMRLPGVLEALEAHEAAERRVADREAERHLELFLSLERVREELTIARAERAGPVTLH